MASILKYRQGLLFDFENRPEYDKIMNLLNDNPKCESIPKIIVSESDDNDNSDMKVSVKPTKPQPSSPIEIVKNECKVSFGF